MSASTVSITANPEAAARRRPVVLSEKKQHLKLVNDGIVLPNVDANGAVAAGSGGDTKATGNRDVSQSFRGEATLERSREVQVKNYQFPHSTVSPRRVRKSSAPKTEEPRWKTLMRIFTKNFCLLLVLVGLVQMVRQLVLNYRIDGSSSLMGFSDMEGRIAEVDSTLKKTTKMLQAQMDAFDGTIKGEVGSLRKDVNHKISEFASSLEQLGQRSENLENALTELSAKKLLTQDDLVKFYDELEEAKGGDIASGLSWDEIRAFAREIVMKEIDKHAADGLGRVDYALASGGAMVLKHSEPFVVGKGSNWFHMPNRQGVHSDAEKMLKPSFGEPGQCFPLKGSSGYVLIKLRTAIIPEAITLEHVAKSVAYDRSSAPKDCRVSGWLQGRQSSVDTEVASDAEKALLLSEFAYDLEKSNAQTYNVFDSASSAVVDTIRYDFTSNHGSPSHTCIYRLRVHGREPKSA